MMSDLFTAFGLVLVIEGLALALAPLRVEDVLARFASMSLERRRLFGLVAVLLGVLVVAVVRQVAV